MTNQEINEAIAKECGWVFEGISSDSNPEDRPCWHNVKTRLVQRHCPDFVNDLNVSAQFEQSLFPVHVHQLSGPDRWKEYRETLDMICVGHAGGSILATARQRAEAFLRMKGKWA